MKEHLLGRLTSQTSLITSRDMFVRSVFQFVFLPSNLAILLWNPPWNSVYTVENPHLAWCLPRRLIKLCLLCPKLNLHAGPPSLDFSKKSRGRNNAKYAFQYKFKNRIGQHRAKKKKKKRKNKLGAFTTGYSPRVTHPVL